MDEAGQLRRDKNHSVPFSDLMRAGGKSSEINSFPYPGLKYPSFLQSPPRNAFELFACVPKACTSKLLVTRNPRAPFRIWPVQSACHPIPRGWGCRIDHKEHLSKLYSPRRDRWGCWIFLGICKLPCPVAPCHHNRAPPQKCHKGKVLISAPRAFRTSCNFVTFCGTSMQICSTRDERHELPVLLARQH
jgi:hypothetical protein